MLCGFIRHRVRDLHADQGIPHAKDNANHENDNLPSTTEVGSDNWAYRHRA